MKIINQRCDVYFFMFLRQELFLLISAILTNESRWSLMSKNDKQKRTDGTITSANTKVATPIKPSNASTSDFAYTSSQKMDDTLHRRY